MDGFSFRRRVESSRSDETAEVEICTTWQERAVVKKELGVVDRVVLNLFNKGNKFR